ncbi:MAG: hypothetical protein ABW069_07270, partial [Duganella sp.]
MLYFCGLFHIVSFESFALGIFPGRPGKVGSARGEHRLAQGKKKRHQPQDGQGLMALDDVGRKSGVVLRAGIEPARLA